ncbi:MAG: NDP-hexose 2,3-dehydratase family protein [Nitrospirae bacterium]|nr:NDP-hexose 2,3-dehydratase family protein [Nitrospirota bacterium]
MPDLTHSSGKEYRGYRKDFEKLLKDSKLFELFDMQRLSIQADGISHCPDKPGHTSDLRDLVQWLDNEKARNHIFVKREGLNTLNDWTMDGAGHLIHRGKKYFRIVGMKITSPYREIMTWSQPILDNEGSGIIGLLMKKIDGRTYFLMQAKADVGNRGIVQIGPTVQFNPGNYVDNERLKKPFLFEEFHDSGNFITVFESRQSEEGGRFYREEHVHKILMLPEGATLDIPDNYRWFSLYEIRFFLHMGDFINSCARSILACLI